MQGPSAHAAGAAAQPNSNGKSSDSEYVWCHVSSPHHYLLHAEEDTDTAMEGERHTLAQKEKEDLAGGMERGSRPTLQPSP